MIKVQSNTPDLGWVLSTRAGMLPQAWSVLASYRRDYPSQRHRLVNVEDDGALTIIPDDDALRIVAEDYEADRAF